MPDQTMARYWRPQWPNQRMSDADLTALTASPKPYSALLAALQRSGTFGFDPLHHLEVALLTQNTVWEQPLNPVIELSGRGYSRPPAGGVAVSGPWEWRNEHLILWPQAKDDWGLATYIAVMQSGDPDDVVLATAPVPAPPFAVIAGDQPRIDAVDLVVGGVLPNTKRPYGVGRYGESVYGGWPADGAVFFVRLDDIGYEWSSLPNACAPWDELKLFSGGCSA